MYELIIELRELFKDYDSLSPQYQAQADSKAEELIKAFASDLLVDEKLQQQLFPVRLKPC